MKGSLYKLRACIHKHEWKIQAKTHMHKHANQKNKKEEEKRVNGL